jgi:multiple antibiotic resistance protein
MISIQTSGQRHTAQEGDEAVSKASITVVPLAIPILAGPGAISTVISSFTNANQAQKAIAAAAIVAVAIAVGIILSLAVKIRELLGVAGTNVLTRIFGLILLSIAVGAAARSLTALFPALCGR